MKNLLMFISVLLLLVACSKNDEVAENENSVHDSNLSNENNAVDHGMKDKSAGFTMDDNGDVMEAEVPEAEAEAILAAHKEYIAAFNEEDMDRYMNVIAQNPEGFDRNEDQLALQEAFENYDTHYSSSNETIVKYTADRAEVFAEIAISVEQAESGETVEQSGRQVVIFKKEGADWKVSGLHFIGNQ